MEVAGVADVVVDAVFEVGRARGGEVADAGGGAGKRSRLEDWERPAKT